MNIAFSLSIIGPQFATSLAEEAIEAGHYHITKLLLKDCHLTNEMLCTATWRGDCRMLNLLLKKKSSTFYGVIHRNHEAVTPLHIAASSGQLQCTKLLLEAGYKPTAAVEFTAGELISPIDEAMINGQLEVLKLFADVIADDEPMKKRIQNYLANYPLH
jgi:ankyrin repeat protein